MISILEKLYWDDWHACATLSGLFCYVLLCVVTFRTMHLYSKLSNAMCRMYCLSVHVTLHWREAELQQCTFV